MVEEIQTHLELIYGIRCESRAEQFLVSLEQVLALGGTGRAPEELLLREDDEGLEVALFLAPDLLARMSSFSANPSDALDDSLDAFCTLTEGVSHFLYLYRALAQDRQISLLELEAQAEVDKFAICVLLRWPSETWGGQLHQRLFDQVSYRSDLTHDERWRYTEANRLSRNYCQGLLPHVRGRRLDRFLSELRYTYRLGAEAKLQRMSRRRDMLAAG